MALTVVREHYVTAYFSVNERFALVRVYRFYYIYRRMEAVFDTERLVWTAWLYE